MTFKLKCPKCDYPQYCPCQSCKGKIPEGLKPWVFKEHDNVHVCSNCESYADLNWWLEETQRQIEKYRKEKNESTF